MAGAADGLSGLVRSQQPHRQWEKGGSQGRPFFLTPVWLLTLRASLVNPCRGPLSSNGFY
jgi:hypothetical protein